MYYLVQTAFWIQMVERARQGLAESWLYKVFVTVVEPWEKDFGPMMAHHFITIGHQPSNNQLSRASGMLCCTEAFMIGKCRDAHLQLLHGLR